MFGLGYRKRCLAAEARVSELETQVYVAIESQREYQKLWRDLIGTPRTKPPVKVVDMSRLALASRAPNVSNYNTASPPPPPTSSFDLGSAVLGGLVAHAITSHSSAQSCERDSTPAFSSGGGGDYGGGGASSSWESSSSSSSSDSCSASSYSSDSSSSSSSSSD